MAVFETVVSGVVVLVAGQVAIRFFIEPIQQLKEALGETSHVLLAYQSKITNNSPSEELIIDLRTRSARLLAARNSIPLYKKVVPRLVSKMGLPTYDSILLASKELNGIAGHLEAALYGAYVPGDAAIRNSKSLSEISRLLQIDTSYG